MLGMLISESGILKVGANCNGFCNKPTKDFKGFNAIWVIVNMLTKSAHFLLVKTTYGFAQYAQLYIYEII